MGVVLAYNWLVTAWLPLLAIIRRLSAAARPWLAIDWRASVEQVLARPLSSLLFPLLKILKTSDLTLPGAMQPFVLDHLEQANKPVQNQTPHCMPCRLPGSRPQPASGKWFYFMEL